ncbi:MAG: GNAT family N-acetyltransferase [Armatimonadetes bacterium]|nr:GNAT family N-acetyltransferase [Armatimonadota bacterium]MDW8120694.1 GNAT family N-acetyltransferase [Armatimonadota bacterium]
MRAISQEGIGIKLKTAQEDEKPVVWDVLCRAFGEGPRERFRRQLWEDSTVTTDQIRLAEVDGHIVSHVWVANRPVLYRGQVVLPMGGIGGVGTLPEYRNQGLATLLLNDAIEYMRAKDQPLSMLFTGINFFYARLGWADFPQFRFRIRVERAPYFSSDDGPYQVRPCQVPEDLPILQEIYKRHSEGLQVSLAHCRPSSFWLDGHPRYLGLRPSHIVIHSPSGQGCAYVCADKTDHGFFIHEFSYDHRHPGVLTVLSKALLSELAISKEPGLIEGVTPWMHPFPQKIATLAQASLFHEVTEAMMLRINDLYRCLEIVTPVLEKDLWLSPFKDQDFALTFHLTDQDQVVTIKCTRGKMELVRGDGGSLFFRITTRLFCLLFFGVCSGRQWCYLANCQDNEDKVAPVLSVLFPPHPTVYWSGDHF